jgi:hypothetical protein
MRNKTKWTVKKADESYEGYQLISPDGKVMDEGTEKSMQWIADRHNANDIAPDGGSLSGYMSRAWERAGRLPYNM